LLVLTPGIASGLQYDLAGTVIRATEEGILDINVTESEDFAGIVQVYLLYAIQNPQSMLNREVQFNVLGKDILGRPVVEQVADDMYWLNRRCSCSG